MVKYSRQPAEPAKCMSSNSFVHSVPTVAPSLPRSLVGLSCSPLSFSRLQLLSAELATFAPTTRTLTKSLVLPRA